MTTAVLTGNKVRHSEEIAFKNDVFRRKGHHLMLTDEAMYLPDVCGLINAVQMFN